MISTLEVNARTVEADFRKVFGHKIAINGKKADILMGAPNSKALVHSKERNWRN